MITYAIGNNNKSKTRKFVLVTIETNILTDMSSFTTNPADNYPIFLSDFYMKYGINIGKIVKITDLHEKDEFDTASVPFNGSYVEFLVGKLFKVDNHDYTSSKKSIQVFKHKLAARESTGYISRSYDGVHYIHFENGTIKQKSYYLEGNLTTMYCYRNDTYNTLKSSIICRDGKPETEYMYDDRETLVSRNIYNEQGHLIKEHIYT